MTMFEVFLYISAGLFWLQIACVIFLLIIGFGRVDRKAARDMDSDGKL